MKDTEKRNRHRGNTKKIRIIIGIFCLFIIGFAIKSAVAKYYAYKSEKGISVASAFYFNSNKLVKVPGATTDDAIEEMDITDMAVNVNESRWTSGDCQFDVEIRNYDNNLLFNEENLNAGYKVCFYLLGEPVGARYYVSYYDEENTKIEKELTTSARMQSFEGNLQGGSLSCDRYYIRIDLTDAEKYEEDTKVLVVAYPTSPEYLYSEENQEHRLVGVFQGHYSEPYMEVQSADFLVQDETDYSADSWKEKVEDLSGYIFNIKTIGDVITDSNNAVKQEAIVKWRSDYIRISQYDEYYRTAEKEDSDTNKWLWTETTDGVEWTYMKIKILPYSSVNITFYKTEKFITEIENDSMTKEVFEGLADAYVEDETQN